MRVFLLISLLVLFIQLLLGCTNQVHEVSEDAHELNASILTNQLGQSVQRAPLMVSTDFGRTWQPATEKLPTDVQVSFLEIKGDEIVLASDNQGLFLSSENKYEWTNISDQLPNQKINALHVSDEQIYAGVYRQGIFRTNDDGKHWQSLNYNLRNLNVQAILVQNAKVYIGTDEGIFILKEGAAQWEATKIQAQVLSIYEYDQKLVAGTNQGTAISHDEGKSWEWIRKEGAVHYTHHVGSNIVELALNGDLVYSNDWGKQWQKMQYAPRAGSYVYEIIEAGRYQLISNNYGIHQSEDQGKTWEHIFKTESMAFFDFVVVDQQIYGGTRLWDEYRKRR